MKYQSQLSQQLALNPYNIGYLAYKHGKEYVFYIVFIIELMVYYRNNKSDPPLFCMKIGKPRLRQIRLACCSSKGDKV